MFVLKAYEAASVAVEYRQIWELVYAPHYYGQLQVSKNRVSAIQLPISEKACSQFWQYFCLHQFLTQALENLLTAVLELVSAEVSGLTLVEICSRLCSEEFLKELRDIHGISCKTPVDLLSSLGLASPQLEPANCLRNQATFSLTHLRSESQILDRNPSSACSRAAVAVSLLAILYAKWAGINTEITRAVSARAGAELHTDIVLPYISEWFDKGSWSQALEPLISRFVLDQHDRIMYEKGKLESCWLHRIDGRVFKDQDYFPSYRSPRTDNSISILRDLGLVTRSADNELTLTTGGNALLKRVIG